jgi:hypothetical protein
MHRWKLSLGIFFGVSALAPAAPVPDTLRSPREQALAELSWCMDFGYAKSHSRDEAAKRRAAFDAALDKLAGCVDESEVARCRRHEGEDLRAKLVVIAHDRKCRPQRYRDLDRETTRTAEDERRLPFAGAPPRGEAVEENRLIWEYLVLRPVRLTHLAAQHRTAVVALGDIGNDASLLTLTHAHRNFWKADEVEIKYLSPRVFELQRSLEDFPSERGLRALLAWMELMDQRLATYPDRAGYRGSGVARLRGTFEGRRSAEWAAVLRRFKPEGLPRQQRLLLEEALKTRVPSEPDRPLPKRD